MNYSLELIRFVAVVLITFTHTKHNFTKGSIYYILEVLPTYGTLVLSVTSGYLYWNHSRHKTHLFQKKIRNLLIPFFIANFSVLLPVLIAHFIGLNILTRLSYDHKLITDGIFALNNAPINPPTYFIRDLFIVFSIIELLLRKNLWMLALLIPLAVFGKLMLRYDIFFLFFAGAVYAHFQTRLNKKLLLVFVFFVIVVTFNIFSGYNKYFIALFFFILLLDLPANFFNVGGYTYLLHLYHAPIMIVLLPFLNATIENEYFKVTIQVVLSLLLTYLLYLTTRKNVKFQIISGGR
ncbi:hypothetical protein FVR03_13140 [Pontibacter qinzhouensis]|uniref:Acyltransferase 3 domain-containing protein n=1 Tax=Pontibacter qinzhouensis TaxID=2603253 RepID=A0A5C8K5J6_9BACT|nr:acyltransferase family protein [Pontibacter qinzhouensis]TXK44894.1 hypothetical protein FVR03_13140 [Pontibacter qinzhouensis]